MTICARFRSLDASHVNVHPDDGRGRDIICGLSRPVCLIVVQVLLLPLRPSVRRQLWGIGTDLDRDS